MGNIKILDKKIADMIAAGEVVERPASVVKELFENAVDAGASRITAEVSESGRALIKITDDGSGMDREDAVLSVTRYATSKLSKEDDLFNIKTMGFRGEALASICAVSKMTVLTRKPDAVSGIRLTAEGGEITNIEDAGCPSGTAVTVENLFFNTPARLKFMKKDAAETAVISETVSQLILANPAIAVKFIRDGREIYCSNGGGNVKSAIYAVCGGNIADNLIEVNFERHDVKVTGYVGNPNIAKPTRKFENFSVNGRACRNRSLMSGLENAYFQRLSQGKYPFCALNIEVGFSLCDVNVHPQKAEVKFSNESDIYDAVYLGAKNALDGELYVRNADETAGGSELFKYRNDNPSYTQTGIFRNTPVNDGMAFNKVENLNFSHTPEVYGNERKEEADEKNDGGVGLNLEEGRPVYFEFRNDEPSEEIPPDNSGAVWTSPYEAYDFKVTGQVFSSYIVLERGEELLILDQHAAHERLNYEEIYFAYQNRAVSSQILMSPKMLEMLPGDYRTVLDNIETYRRLGIYLEDFNDGTVIVREIPNGIQQGQIEKLVYEILEEIILHGKANSGDINLKLLFTVACKMSLKANTELTHIEMEELVKRAFALSGKSTCPHGRPMFISFSKSFLENKFGRS